MANVPGGSTPIPHAPVLDVLQAWRRYWANEYADDLTLTGKQADELCRMLVDGDAGASDREALILAFKNQARLGSSVTLRFEEMADTVLAAFDVRRRGPAPEGE